MAEERIPVAGRREGPDRLEPAWHELADAGEAMKLKARQDARSEAWKAGRKAEPAHPEQYEGVLLVGGKRYSVKGSYRAEPAAGGKGENWFSRSFPGFSPPGFICNIPELDGLQALTNIPENIPKPAKQPQDSAFADRPKTDAERAREYRARKKAEREQPE